VLAAALTFIVALEVPDAGVNVSHEASAGFLTAAHATFEVTVTGCVDPACRKLSEDVLTASEAATPGCVIVICLLVTPVPLSVIVAVRCVVVVLASAVTFIVALEVPDAGVNVSHEASDGFLAAVHATLAVTVTGSVEPACGNESEELLTASEAAIPGCVIVICLLVTPVPLIVIVAVRCVVVVLAVALTLSVPPADPVSVLYVSHVAVVGFLAIVTATLAVTVTGCVEPACGKLSEDVLTASAAVTPGCVMDICLLVTPVPLIVIVAVRCVVVVLAVALTLSVPPAVPDRVLYVSHAASVGDLLTVTATLAVTVTDCTPPACRKLSEDVSTASEAAIPGCVIVICLLVTPVPLSVIVAVRCVVVVLASAVTLSVPPADPDSVLYVNHVAVVGSFVTVTATLAVTVTGIWRVFPALCTVKVFEPACTSRKGCFIYTFRRGKKRCSQEEISPATIVLISIM
jgi:hypothetical protein